MGKIKYVAALAFLAVSCSFLGNHETPVSQLSKLLNLSEEMKNEITNCKGEFSEVTPSFMSWGYFTYHANDTFIKKLMSKKTFLSDSDLNTGFKKVPVGFPFKENDLSFYTDYLKDKSIIKKIELENKVVLEGVYYPYKQQILYDTITKEAIHLISGLRE
jgi:hypothetical protein